MSADGWRLQMATCISISRHRRCPVCQEMIDLDHAEALVDQILMRIGPDDTIPTVEAIIAAEVVTDTGFAMVG